MGENNKKKTITRSFREEALRSKLYLLQPSLLCVLGSV